MKTWHRSLLLLGVQIALLSLLLPHTAHAAYRDDNLIDDYIYRNSSTMDANGIQVFLNSKGGALANYTDPAVNKSAAQIIFDNAQAYGINPQVILAMLQKEQSLVTDPSPTDRQYTYAMGYGCPDSGTCSYPGFNTQVLNGTWQLRYNVEANSGRDLDSTHPASAYPCKSASNYYSTGLYPGRTVTFYNDYGTAYKTITLANAATASLYCYTPHVYPGSSQQYYSGSYNFVTSFEAWFGPSTGEGYVLATSSANNGDLRQWVVYRGIRRYVPDTNMLKAWGLDKVDLVQMTGLYLGSIPQAADLSRLMRPTGTLDVYFVDGGKCYRVRSPDMMASWNFNASAIMDVSVGLGQVPANSGNLTYSVKNAAGTIFLIDGGGKHLYANNSIQAAWEGGNTPHQVISDAYLQAMGQAADITDTRATYGGKYYLMNEGRAFVTVDWNIGNAWGVTYAIKMNSDISPEFAPYYMLTRFVRSAYPNDLRLFIVDNGTLYLLSPEHAVNLGMTPSTPRMAIVPESVTPSISAWGWVMVHDSSGKQYVIDGGTKRPFHPDGQVQNSWTAYGTMTTPQVSNGFLNLLPNNGNIEREIKGSGLPQYVVEGTAKRWVQSPSTSALYAPLQQVSDSLVNALPNGSNL